MAAYAEAVVETIYHAVTLDRRFWLGGGVTWQQVHSQAKGELKPLPQYLVYVPAIALVILLTRFLYERYVALPLGRYLRVSERKPTPAEPNAVLEKAYQHNPKPNNDLVLGLSKAIDKPVRFVERWYRRKCATHLPSQMRKFQEGSWRFLAFLVLLTAGLLVVPNKPFWSNTRLSWEGYPNFSMPVDIFWYYMVELAFYVSLTVSQFLDIKRKDFWQMFIHHIATILLILLSYCTHFFGSGSMIMLIHDMADPLLELAKVLGYTRQPGEGRTAKQTTGEVLFIVFMLTFFYTRLYMFPAHLIYSSWFEMLEIVGKGKVWPLWGLLNSLLLILYALHWFWSFQIIRVVRESIIAGKVKGDVRSGDEGSAFDDDEDKSEEAPRSKVLPAAPSTNGHGNHGRGSQRR